MLDDHSARMCVVARCPVVQSQTMLSVVRRSDRCLLRAMHSRKGCCVAGEGSESATAAVKMVDGAGDLAAEAKGAS